VAITDYTIPAAELASFAPRGRIGLQVHGGEKGAGDDRARFRNLRLRELPRARAAFHPASIQRDASGNLQLTPHGRADGWTVLFDGKDLRAFEPVTEPDGFAVRDGLLCLLAKGTTENLKSREDYQDFALRLDFRIAKLANSGVFLRASRTEPHAAMSGREVQILDDFHWEAVTKTKLKPWQFTGSLYGAVAPRVTDALRPIGEWNTFEILLHGTAMVTRLNGQELYEVDTAKLTPEQGKPFTERAPTGWIGLQRHAPAQAGGEGEAGEVYAWFRNVFVKRLESAR
jgi:hypothetical protein